MRTIDITITAEATEITETLTTAQIIDQHRVDGTWNIGTGTSIVCVCGNESTALVTEFLDITMTRELNPRRTAERRHAEHVASMLP